MLYKVHKIATSTCKEQFLPNLRAKHPRIEKMMITMSKDKQLEVLGTRVVGESSSF
jgi:hypothetical protein